jgi:hypothetical protein
LPKQSLGFQRIASLRSARNDSYKLTLNEYIKILTPNWGGPAKSNVKSSVTYLNKDQQWLGKSLFL